MLGYLLPSIATVGSLLVAESIYFKQESTEAGITTIAITLLPSIDTPIAQVAYGLFGFLTLYLVGHIVSAVSSLLFDRILNARVFGYPYQSLIFPQWPRQRRTHSASFWLTIFSLCAAYLAILTAEIFVRSHSTSEATSLARLRIAQQYTGWAIVTCVITKALLRQFQIWLERAPQSPGTSQPELKRRLKSAVSFCLDWPFKIIAFPASQTCNIARIFIHGGPHGLGDASEELPRLIRLRFQSDFGLLLPERFPGSANDDPVRLSRLTSTYWFPALFLLDRKPSIWINCVHFLRLYSFARNCSAGFLIGGLYGLSLAEFGRARAVDWTSLGYFTCATFTLSAITLYRYFYLYHSYYSKYLFRAYYYASIAESREAQSQTVD